MIALIGLSVLCVTGCSSTRSVTAHSSTELTTGYTNVTNERDSIVVATQDTVKEVTTVTVQLDAVGDTVKVSTVTDRTRASVRDRVKDVEVKVVEKTDTVFVQKTDSVFVERSLDCARDDSGGRTSPFTRAVKWLVALVVVLCVLIALVKFRVLKTRKLE